MRQDLIELPGWSFEVDEISAGVYQVRGTDKAGRSVGSRGTDPDALLLECKKAALRIVQSVHGDDLQPHN